MCTFRGTVTNTHLIRRGTSFYSVARRQRTCISVVSVANRIICIDDTGVWKKTLLRKTKQETFQSTARGLKQQFLLG